MSLGPETKQLKKAFRKHLIHRTLLETGLWLLDKGCMSPQVKCNWWRQPEKYKNLILERMLQQNQGTTESCWDTWRIQPDLQEIWVGLYLGK